MQTKSPNDPSNTLHVPGSTGSVGADVVDASRTLTVVGASDGSGSSIIVGYNSSLASKFSVRDDIYTTVGNGLNNDGNLTFAAGHGVDFSSQSDYGTGETTTSSLLDDYEEGTFTPPSVGGNATYNSQIGKYVKIGRSVTIKLELHINVIGTGSTSTITGIPFVNPIQKHHLLFAKAQNLSGSYGDVVN